jgi:hypothetical protein
MIQQTHYCQQEDLLRAMHGDLKAIIAKNDILHEKLCKYNEALDQHVTDSYHYRRRIDSMWTGMHVVKWVIGLLLGAGLIWKAIEVVVYDNKNQTVSSDTINYEKNKGGEHEIRD